MNKQRLLAWLALPTLPLAVWGIVAWTARHTHPWYLVGCALALLALTALVIHKCMPAWYHQYRDARMATGVLAFLMILPAIALLSGINLLGKRTARMVTWELMESYNRGPSDGVYLFLWTGNALHKERVSVGDPLVAARPGDSVRLDYRRGLLGLEYLYNVHPVR